MEATVVAWIAATAFVVVGIIRATQKKVVAAISSAAAALLALAAAVSNL